MTFGGLRGASHGRGTLDRVGGAGERQGHPEKVPEARRGTQGQVPAERREASGGLRLLQSPRSLEGRTVKDQ